MKESKKPFKITVRIGKAMLDQIDRLAGMSSSTRVGVVRIIFKTFFTQNRELVERCLDGESPPEWVAGVKANRFVNDEAFEFIVRFDAGVELDLAALHKASRTTRNAVVRTMIKDFFERNKDRLEEFYGKGMEPEPEETGGGPSADNKKNAISREEVLQYIYDYGKEEAGRLLRLTEEQIDEILYPAVQKEVWMHKWDYDIKDVKPEVARAIAGCYDEIKREMISGRDRDCSLLGMGGEDYFHNALMRVMKDNDPEDVPGQVRNAVRIARMRWKLDHRQIGEHQQLPEEDFGYKDNAAS